MLSFCYRAITAANRSEYLMSDHSDPMADTMVYPMDWTYAWGGPAGKALFKEQPEDFIVEEVLPFEPDGEGEHVLLYVEKQGENTDWVAGRLAKFAKVKRMSVSYAGRKDRHGITRQWFSVWMPGMEEPNWISIRTRIFVFCQCNVMVVN